MKLSELDKILDMAQEHHSCDIFCSCNCGRRLKKEEVREYQYKTYGDREGDLDIRINALFNLSDIINEAKEMSNGRRFIHFVLEIDNINDR